eukprot:51105_1
MGTAQTVPNAEEQVGTTLFQVDFVVWTITATGKTILFLIWFLHAYFNVNLIPIRHESTKVLQTKTRTIEVLQPNASHTDNCSSPENMSSSRSTAPVASVQTDLGTPCTRPSMQSSQSKETNETSADAIMRATSKETEDSPRMNALGRFYITMSIAMALSYSYYQVILHALRRHGIVTEVHCALIVPNIGWALNRLFLYLYFMLRLELSFRGTFLEIKANHWRMLIALYCVLISVGVVFYYFYVSYVGCDSLGILVGFLPLSGMDSFCSLVCLYIFVKKLKSLANLDRIAYDRDPETMTELKYLVNKFLVISLFAIIFTYFVSAIFFIYPATCLAGIDTIVNVFCLMITTAHFDFYYRMSCVFCRRCCEKSFTFTRQLQKDTPAVIIH